MKSNKLTLWITTITIFLFSVQLVDANALYHATRRATAKKIASTGFLKTKANLSARFGKKIYASPTKKLALKEKPTADAIVVIKTSPKVTRNTIDTRKLSTGQLKKISGDKDLRGNIKKGVIGPKLGNKIGKYADKTKRTVKYRSQKDPTKANTAIPFPVYDTHPRSVHPVKWYPVK